VKRRNLVIATFNSGKLQELRQLLSELPFVISDLDGFSSIQAIPEVGKTFVENASLKAAGYAKQTGRLTLADDSGLEVDALNGAPGVLSARYAHEGASDAERTSKLLTEMSQCTNRTARFVSVIAIASEDGRVINLSTGTCEGQIAQGPRGNHGFGYDPVFIPEGFSQTFAELQTELKNRISHRARALSGAAKFLRSLTAPSDDG
jgi:non-canonical purine NTP pyrophosphatase (RdgB/HAM1 family)